ncbi:MAG: type II toxin-antitoxin system RelE/ParE family toxin [Coriobacteriia bacterium]|nr:type II toxin-antitoxin system RelE/ParE family toxin [Coriobacteriia bacterium]
MIKNFKDRATEDVFSGERVPGFPDQIVRRARRKLFALDAAMRVEDLRLPPGNKLHALTGGRKGQFAISINDQWRICFRFDDGCAYDVEICDYH